MAKYKYLVDIDYFTVSGYSHSETIDSGESENFFSALLWADAFGMSAAGYSCIDVKISFYNSDSDPLFNEPIKTETATIFA